MSYVMDVILSTSRKTLSNRSIKLSGVHFNIHFNICQTCSMRILRTFACTSSQKVNQTEWCDSKLKGDHQMNLWYFLKLIVYMHGRHSTGIFFIFIEDRVFNSQPNYTRVVLNYIKKQNRKATSLLPLGHDKVIM